MMVSSNDGKKNGMGETRGVGACGGMRGGVDGGAGGEPELVSALARVLTSERAWWIMVGLLLLTALATGVRSIFFRDNDFLWHYNLGRGVLDGLTYRDGNGEATVTHYPLGRGLMNALFAWMPYRLARAVMWSVGIGAVGLALGSWHRMANVGWFISRRVAMSAGLLTVLIMLNVVDRDLDECGLQLVLVAMVGLAGVNLVMGRDVRAGCWLALAFTHKVTPILFLGYLLFKRRWRAAMWMVVFIGVFNVVLPSMYFGIGDAARANGQFIDSSVAGMRIVDPSANLMEDAKHQNNALRFAVARYLMTFGPRHTLYLAEPGQKDENNQVLLVPIEQIRPAKGFVQFGDMSAKQASRVILGVLLVLAGILAWRFRRPTGRLDVKTGIDTRRDISAEWAAVLLLCALLSPLCWKQHLVMAMPCLFVIVRLGLVRPNRWYRDVLMFLVIVSLLPLRVFLGREGTLVFMSYNTTTVAMLILMGLALTLPLAPPEVTLGGPRLRRKRAIGGG